jgi:acyl-coenzyme A thioesterase PaaI-like protein
VTAEGEANRNPYVPPGPDHTNPPLTPRQEELRRVGEALRSLIAGVVATEAPTGELAALATDLERIATGWAGHPRRTSYAFAAEAGPGGDVHAFLDDSPMIGRANPLAPPLHLQVEPDTDPPAVVGTACFGPQYEGPPGHVHGGYLAAAFDEVLGMAQSLGGKPGMTGTLTVRYRSPTPLHVQVALRGWVERVEGRKIFTRGTAHVDGRLCAEAEAIFISIDFRAMAALAQRREQLRG